MPKATRAAAALIAAATLTTAARAGTTMTVQVSRALAEDWHSSINASPGDSIDVRIVVSHTGDPALGSCSTMYQPTVSDWTAGDHMAPLVNGGIGGQVTVPIGAVQDLPGQYGRIIPYAQFAFSSTAYLRGHVNTVAGISYLRIAQSQVTSWFGGPGNTSAGSGLYNFQLNNVGRTTADPPLQPCDDQPRAVQVQRHARSRQRRAPRNGRRCSHRGSLREHLCRFPVRQLVRLHGRGPRIAS
jgi:hypothetical protein